MIGDHAGEIAGHGSARRDIAGDDAAGIDYGIVTNTHPGKQDGAAADPGIAADVDWAPELQPSPARLQIARVVGGVDLHRGTDLRPIANYDQTTSRMTQSFAAGHDRFYPSASASRSAAMSTAE